MRSGKSEREKAREVERERKRGGEQRRNKEIDNGGRVRGREQEIGTQ